jgi:transcriptional regulator with XRE-family HTH domain
MAGNMLPDRFDATPLTCRALKGEAQGTKGAAAEFGRVIVRAREILGITQKELAFRLGHADHTRVSKWEAGIENPQMAALYGIEGYRGAFLVASAEAHTGKDISVEHTITWRRRA